MSANNVSPAFLLLCAGMLQQEALKCSFAKARPWLTECCYLCCGLGLEVWTTKSDSCHMTALQVIGGQKGHQWCVM